MTKKYAVLNPSIGAYDYANTEIDALDVLAKNVMDFYVLHTHGSPISIVTENKDGSSSWEPLTDKDLFDIVNAETIKEKYVLKYISSLKFKFIE